MSIALLSSIQNYVTATVQIFYWNGALNYALPMPAAYISRSFSAASMNAMWTLSLESTLVYVIDSGGSVIWLPSTSIALWTKLKYIFMSKIIWHLISCEIFLKATIKFSISFWIDCSQKLVPVYWSISRSSLAIFGTIITKLWVCLQYRVLTLEIMRYLRCDT